MSYKIILLPSEHEFEAEANETLLEAALRAGLNINYNCNSGSCGDCKAQVVHGDFNEIRHHDFQLTEAEKLQRHTLLCSIAATSDMVIEAAEALGVQDITRQSLSVKVARLEPVGDDVMVLHLRTPRSKTLRFLAGQMIVLKTAGGLSTQIAVASCPCNGMMLQCHLLRDANDEFSCYVFDQLQASETLSLEGPLGNFTLDDASKRPSVMVAQGIGFAPVKSLVEHAIALDHEQAMQLYWVAASGSDHYQSNYCRAWEDAFDMFVYTPLVLGVQHTEEDMQQLVQDIIVRSPIESEIDLYLSCESELTARLTEAFVAQGTPPDRIFIVTA